MKIEDMSDLRAIGFVLSGYAAAKEDAFLQGVSDDILLATLPEGAREEIDREIAAINESWKVSEDTTEQVEPEDAAPDLTTQEPQEEDECTSAIVQGGYELYCGRKTYFYKNRLTYEAACLNFGIEPLPEPQSEIIDATEEVTDKAAEASVEDERAKTRYVEHNGAIAYGIMDSHGAENYPLDARDLYVEDCASYGIDPLPVPSSIAKPADVPVGEPDFGPRES